MRRGTEKKLIWVIIAHVGTEVGPDRVVCAFDDSLWAFSALEKMEKAVAELRDGDGGWKESWEDGLPVLVADSAFYDIPGDRSALRSLGLPSYRVVSTMLEEWVNG